MKKLNKDLCHEFLVQLKAWSEQQVDAHKQEIDECDVLELKKAYESMTELYDDLEGIEGIYNGKEVKCLVSAYLDDLTWEDLEYIDSCNDFSYFNDENISQTIYL